MGLIYHRPSGENFSSASPSCCSWQSWRPHRTSISGNGDICLLERTLPGLQFCSSDIDTLIYCQESHEYETD